MKIKWKELQWRERDNKQFLQDYIGILWNKDDKNLFILSSSLLDLKIGQKNKAISCYIWTYLCKNKSLILM